MFYKEKGFYISLLCGVAALVAFALICSHLLGDDGGEGAPIVASETEAPTPTATEDAREASTGDAQSEVKEEAEETNTPTPTEATLESSSKNVESSLSFDEEAGLMWPVEGEVIMEYSADKVVYFKTLAQYRTNPALIIGATEGEDVKASADGVVKSVSTSEETGRTVTVSIGDDYTLTYGQLKDVEVAKGDSVTAGQVIGKVAEPTKYYTLEGANLYFQVKEKKETVNPMLLLN